MAAALGVQVTVVEERLRFLEFVDDKVAALDARSRMSEAGDRGLGGRLIDTTAEPIPVD
jgi:pyruvate/2-oxoglutarate dehydrogenase complex dihydrolipoamide dehydrogenase (E3) component